MWLLVPLAMLMGWFIINAEPAVHILNRQVEELSAGTISARAMGREPVDRRRPRRADLRCCGSSRAFRSCGSSCRGTLVALGLSFFVPRTFTAIAFDSGGVASGPLTATFMLPLAMGACGALGGNVMTDAFGLVALVAMMPLITVQVDGRNLRRQVPPRGEADRPCRDLRRQRDHRTAGRRAEMELYYIIAITDA